jgi:hypothetical protein
MYINICIYIYIYIYIYIKAIGKDIQQVPYAEKKGKSPERKRHTSMPTISKVIMNALATAGQNAATR